MRDDLIRALEDTIARPTCEFLRIDRKAAVELLALLQPQAREDAQPVAWLRPDTLDKLKSASVSMMGIQSLVAAHETKYNTVSVYTHPAPDALRDAVEALEPFANAFRGLSSRWEDHETHWQDATSPIAVEDLRRAALALAALQAEQKGGA